MKKVSVVVPCYCAKREWIERLFHSIQRQTLGMDNIELIFVIDASPDNTFEMLQEYEAMSPENVMIVNSDEKVGPGGARTIGITYASGEYISFVDQDDWLEPCMYEHMYQKAIMYDCDMVESYNTRDRVYRYHEGEPQRTGKEDALYVLDSIEQKKIYFRDGQPEERKYWAKIYKRSFLLENEVFFPANIKYDDNFFKGLTFYLAKRIYVLEEYLYHWMVNDESISMQNDFEAHLDRMRVEKMKLEEYDRRGLLCAYHDEIEYIFLEQYFANTLNTIFTRNKSMVLELLEYIRQDVREYFPKYKNNPYIELRNPVWNMGFWITNALRGIEQVRGSSVDVPETVLKKIAPLSFLDLLEADITQTDLDWFCGIYVAFDKAAKYIDFGKLKGNGE